MLHKKRSISILLTVAIVSVLGFSFTSSVFAQEESATIEVHWRPCEEVPADGDWHGTCHDNLTPVHTQTGRTITVSNTETGETFQGSLDDSNNAIITVPAGIYSLVRDAGPNVAADYLYCSLSDGHGRSGAELGDPMTIEPGQHIVCDYYFYAELGGHLDPAPGTETEETNTPSSEPTSMESNEAAESNEEPTTTELENIQLQIIPADCATADQDGSLVDLSPLTIGSGENVGADDAINIVTSWTNAGVSLETLIENDHSLVLLNTEDGATIACGNIGGIPGTGDALVIGLTSPGADGDANDIMVGVAYLQPGGESVSISVFVREDIGNTD